MSNKKHSTFIFVYISRSSSISRKYMRWVTAAYDKLIIRTFEDITFQQIFYRRIIYSHIGILCSIITTGQKQFTTVSSRHWWEYWPLQTSGWQFKTWCEREHCNLHTNVVVSSLWHPARFHLRAAMADSPHMAFKHL